MEPQDVTDDRRGSSGLFDGFEAGHRLVVHTRDGVDLDSEPPDDMLLHDPDIEKHLRYRTLPYHRVADGVSVVTDSVASARQLMRDHARYPPIREIVTCEPRMMDRCLRAAFGPELNERATSLLARTQPSMSARSPVAPWMKAAMVALGAGLVGIASIAPSFLATAVFILLLPYCIASMILKGVLAVTALLPRGGNSSTKPVRRPIVTLLVPLFRESRTLPILIQSLEQLDYPPEKLDVKFLVEAIDLETQLALSELKLPSFIETVLIPHSLPQTKPKAMNFALPFARGEIVGIYDAEDVPEPDQIKKAVAALEAADPKTVCVQARLNHYNAGEHWLPRCASMEYALWFDMLLNGLSRLKLPVPLGGTSLFIKVDALRAVGGWDPDNVTEDADLGMRLARKGWRAEIIDSTTIEEAPQRVGSWISQRSRWIKGFMVTWMVHMRSPSALVRELGWRNALAVNVMLLDGFVAFLAQPFFLIALVWWLGTGATPWAANLGGSLALWTGVAFLVGQIFILAAAFVATERRFGPLRAIQAPFLWLYWQLGAVAAYRALWEVFTNRTSWAKTEHGASQSAQRRRRAAETACVSDAPPPERRHVRSNVAAKNRDGQPRMSESSGRFRAHSHTASR